MASPDLNLSLAGRVLRRLIDDRHITGDQIAEICDVSPSTVYRWTRGQSEPDFDRVVRLVRRVTVPEVRHGLVELFTDGLAVEVEWPEGEEGGPLPDSSPPGADALDLCLLTLSCLGQVMLNQRKSISEDRFTEEAKSDLLRLLSGAQTYLAAARTHVKQQPVGRKKARTTPKAPR